MRAELARRGYQGEQPTLVMVAEVAAVRALVSQTSCEISDRADEAWASVFLGAGFDPIDGACRVRSLGRSVGSAFGSLVVDGATVAVGCGAFGHGWASFHGMRTDLGHRGKGYAGQVLVALAQEAAQRGYVRAFLQVEEQNHAARSLYQRAGFETAWRYGYWSQP